MGFTAQDGYRSNLCRQLIVSQLLYSQLVPLSTQGNNGKTGWSQADNEYPKNYSNTSKRKKYLSQNAYSSWLGAFLLQEHYSCKDISKGTFTFFIQYRNFSTIQEFRNFSCCSRSALYFFIWPLSYLLSCFMGYKPRLCQRGLERKRWKEEMYQSLHP